MGILNAQEFFACGGKGALLYQPTHTPQFVFLPKTSENFLTMFLLR